MGRSDEDIRCKSRGGDVSGTDDRDTTRVGGLDTFIKRLSSTTPLEFFPAPTRARIVPTHRASRFLNLFLPPAYPLHHPRCRSALPDLARHELHIRIDVREEGFIPFAEVIQPVLTRGGLNESVLGASAVAHESDVTLATVLG